MSGRQIAYLCVPHFGTVVARQASGNPGKRPLVLLDDQARVLAADGEAAHAGVTSGMTEREAVARCPGTQFQAASRYPIWEAQASLEEQVKRFADRWQPAGLGNVYLGFDHAGAGDELLGWCQALAGDIRRLGWEPALGATGSKFGASVAAQVAGRNTALLLVPRAQQSFLESQSVGYLPLDSDALAQLRHLGIRTLGQYAHLPAAGVLARFGQAGRSAQRWAQGLDERSIVPPWEAPEASARIEFDAPLADRERIQAALARRVEQLLMPLQARLQVISWIALTVTRADGRIVSGRHAFAQPVAALGPLRLGLEAALGRVTWDGQAAAGIALTLGGLVDAPVRQLSLLDSAETPGGYMENAEQGRVQLKTTLDHLATRFGPDAFRVASLVAPDHLLPERRVSWRSFDA